MARKTDVETISGRKVWVQQFEVLDASCHLLVLGRLVGPAFAQLGGSADARSVLAKLPEMFRALGPESTTDLRAFARALEGCSKVAAGKDGVAADTPIPLKISDHFDGDLAGFFEWLVLGVRVNYASFLVDLMSSLGASGKTSEASASPSPSTLSGESGGS